MRAIALFLSLLCCLTVASAEAGRKKKAPQTVSPSLTTMITRAKEKIAGASVGTSKIGGHYAVLAVWKKGTSKLVVVKVRKGRSVTKGYRVTLLKRNGVNSEYRVDAPEGYVVLALKTNVTRRPSRRASHSVPTVYVPYGPHLDTTALRRAGLAHLTDVARKAAARLKLLHVRSLVDPSQDVTSLISMKALITLLVIEHIDPDDFEARGTEATVHRVLTLIGANRDDAYDQAFSDADAGGLAQFRPGSYQDIRWAYPAAELKRGFFVGVRDHVNGVMAQYCYADFTLAQLAKADFERLRHDTNELGPYIAAAYNHGLYGAAKILAKYPRGWDHSGNGFSEANLQYVKEFRAVYRYLWDP